ncbi:MAG: hypothetical protein Q9213_008411 [Squamulea squamosa]
MPFLVLFLSATISSLVGALPTVTQHDTILIQGFNFPADTELVNNILAAFNDAVELLRLVVDTAAWNTPIFDLYFPPETRDGIAATFQNILSGAPGKFAFDNTPRTDIQDPQHRDICVTRHPAAFAINFEPEPAVHVCPLTWRIPKLSDIAAKVCEGSQMTLNMRYQGSILVHEFSHLKVFHPGRDVIDVGYGPLFVQNLRKDPKTVDNAINNADNYMWFALEAYWTKRCGKAFAPPTSNT